MDLPDCRLPKVIKVLRPENFPQSHHHHVACVVTYCDHCTNVYLGQWMTSWLVDTTLWYCRAHDCPDELITTPVEIVPASVCQWWSWDLYLNYILFKNLEWHAIRYHGAILRVLGLRKQFGWCGTCWTLQNLANWECIKIRPSHSKLYAQCHSCSSQCCCYSCSEKPSCNQVKAEKLECCFSRTLYQFKTQRSGHKWSSKATNNSCIDFAIHQLFYCFLRPKAHKCSTLFGLERKGNIWAKIAFGDLQMQILFGNATIFCPKPLKVSQNYTPVSSLPQYEPKIEALSAVLYLCGIWCWYERHFPCPFLGYG